MEQGQDVLRPKMAQVSRSLACVTRRAKIGECKRVIERYGETNIPEALSEIAAKSMRRAARGDNEIMCHIYSSYRQGVTYGQSSSSLERCFIGTDGLTCRMINLISCAHPRRDETACTRRHALQAAREKPPLSF